MNIHSYRPRRTVSAGNALLFSVSVNKCDQRRNIFDQWFILHTFSVYTHSALQWSAHFSIYISMQRRIQLQIDGSNWFLSSSKIYVRTVLLFTTHFLYDFNNFSLSSRQSYAVWYHSNVRKVVVNPSYLLLYQF